MEHTTNDKVEATSRFLCFTLDKKKFAIPLLDVKEVIGNLETTPFPQSPAYFRGIIDLRGQVIPVIDMRQRLKMSKANAGEDTTILILELSHAAVGVTVDSVDCVAAYGQSEISPPPEFSAHSEFVSGVARGGDSLTLLLDLKSLVEAPELKKLNVTQKAS